MVLVVGKRGQGKSTFAKRSMAGWKGLRIVAFDPWDEYSRGGNKAPGVELGPLRQRIDAGELLDAPELLDAEDLSLSVVPSSSKKQRAQDFKDLVELVRFTAPRTGGLVLVVDECWLLKDFCAETLGELGTQSRHEDIALVLVSQRAVHVHPDCRSQASVVVAFRQDHPADLEALADVYGANGKVLATQVSRLKPHDFVLWTDREGVISNPAPQAPSKKGK